MVNWKDPLQATPVRDACLRMQCSGEGLDDDGLDSLAGGRAPTGSRSRQSMAAGELRYIYAAAGNSTITSFYEFADRGNHGIEV